ncbi:MAG: Panacea domain-containing protein [Patescibacteria group bacterium]|jgi:uncharacterized phage-associated protein
MKENTDKLKKLVVFILQRFNNEKLTETKLQKLLYYCDFNHFQQEKKSITGFIYRKNNFGPTVMDLPKILKEMESEKLITILAEKNYYGSPQKRFSVVTKEIIPEDYFQDSERLIINQVNEAYKELTPREISRLSHADFPYAATENMGDEIDYTLVNFREEQADDIELDDEDTVNFFNSSNFSTLMDKADKVLRKKTQYANC